MKTPAAKPEMLERLRGGGNDLAGLMAIWRGRDPVEWAGAVEVYRLLGERFLKQGEPLLACDVVREGLGEAGADVRLRQLQGLALARSGAMARASEILEQLRAEKHADEETLGMLARTYKDRAAQASGGAERRKFLRRAATIYAQAYRVSKGYWTGINAATTALLLGETSRAARLAKEVRAACRRELQRTPGDQYYLYATLGEAALILQDWEEAADWYARAGQIGRGRFGDLHSSRRNARLLLGYWKADGSAIEASLRLPRVAVFAGHMIDQPGRRRPRFPESNEGAVAAVIREKIAALDLGLGFSSAACGADILFLEAMLAAGREISIVLPYDRARFIRDSVEVKGATGWRRRFEKVEKRASRILIASPQKLELGGVSYEYTNQLLLGLATIRAQQLGTELVPMIVWDGAAGDGPGGTASTVERWSTLARPLEIIDPSGAKPVSRKKKTARAKSSAKPGRRPPRVAKFASQIMAMLFADAVGFSRLSEEQVPRFVHDFMGAIGKLVRQARHEVLAKNTWGDGLYLVFNTAESAAGFALDLCDLVVRTDWTARGLPEELNLRIGLHAGPVYVGTDPITGARNFFGTHVSRAARIEPITPAGQVYASEAFAALAAGGGAARFGFDYAGQTPMAKGYGTFPMYHVRHAASRNAP